MMPDSWYFGPLPSTITEKTTTSDFNIYSTHGAIVIQKNSASAEKGTVMVYDMLGKVIAERSLENNSETRIATDANYAQAIYFVKITTENKSITKKICITQ